MGKSFCLCCNQLKDLTLFNDKSSELGFCIECYNLNEEFTVLVEQKAPNNEFKQLTISNSNNNPNIDYLQSQISVLTHNLAKLSIEFNEFKDLVFDLQIQSLESESIKEEITKESEITLQEEIPKTPKILDIDQIVAKLDYSRSKIRFDKSIELWYSLEDDIFKEVMIKVYNLTHKRQIKNWNNHIEDWSNKYPDLISKKIKAIQKNLKRAHKDLEKSKASTERYYSKDNLNFRAPTIRKMLNSHGHLNISDDCLWDSLKSYYKWENEDIVNDLIAHKNDNPDNDIQIEDEYEKKEITKEILKDVNLNTLFNERDILNRYRE